MYFVSRQFYYYQQINVVEIAYPSIDSSGPDMLIEKYAGEGEEYKNPIEALEIALNIASNWQVDIPDEDIFITFGCMEFGEGEPINPKDLEALEELKQNIQKHYESLPKCSYCGELIDEKEYYINEDSQWTDDKFCSEFHAEKAYLEDYTFCYVCEKEFIRKDMNYRDIDIYVCDKCQDLEDSYKLIEIQKISDDSFVGYSLEDQNIIRYLIGKTYIDEKELSLLEDRLEKLLIDINFVDEDGNIINTIIWG